MNTAKNVSSLPERNTPQAVEGGCHRAFGAHDNDEPAVIVNPKASAAQLLSWARGQVEILEAFHAEHAGIGRDPETVDTVRTAYATETMLSTIGQVLDAAQARLKPKGAAQ